MKRFFLFLLLIIAIGGLCYWMGRESGIRDAAAPDAPKPYHTVEAGEPKGESSFTPSGSTPVKPGATPLLDQMNAELTSVVAAVQPSVVNLDLERDIDIEDKPLGMRFPDKLQSVGSGVIISHEGHIITNAHVVAESDRIKVTLFDDREALATVVGTDVLSDIAVLRIEADDLKPLPWGSSDDIRIGEMVLALGNPLANKNSVSTGIISAIGRNADDGMGRYEDYIQTDASVNPGNSGGALVNIKGELIGINTAIATQSGGFEGISYAIPSKLARFSVESLLKNGRVVRGYLGVAIDNVEGAQADALGVIPGKGVLVVDVRPGTPAERAKLEPFDVITSFNGEEVRDVSELRLAVAFTPVGEETEIEVYRKGEKQLLPISVDEMPDDISFRRPKKKDGKEGTAAKGENVKSEVESEAPSENVFAGVKVEALTEEFRKSKNLPETQTGVVLTEVPDGWKPSEYPGKGDVITEIRTGHEQVHPITSPEDFNKVVREIAPAQAVHVVYMKFYPQRKDPITRITFLEPKD